MIKNNLLLTTLNKKWKHRENKMCFFSKAQPWLERKIALKELVSQGPRLFYFFLAKLENSNGKTSIYLKDNNLEWPEANKTLSLVPKDDWHKLFNCETSSMISFACISCC